MRPLDEIERDARGFSRSTFRYDPPHSEDHGIGTCADWVEVSGRLVADDNDHEDKPYAIDDEIDEHVAVSLANMLNDVAPLVAYARDLLSLLAEAGHHLACHSGDYHHVSPVDLPERIRIALARSR